MNILVIRFSSIGDILLTTPVVRAIQIQLNAQVDFITKQRYRELLELNPHIRSVYDLENLDITELKKANYRCIVDLHNNTRSLSVRQKLNTKSYYVSRDIINKWLFRLARIDRYGKQHMVEKFLNVVQPLGITNDNRGLEFHLNPSLPIRASYKERKTIAISLGGTYITKRIPYSLIQPLFGLRKEKFVLLGGEDVELPEVNHPNVTNLVGSTSLMESAVEIAQADVVLTGDTGMMHIAAALQKPIIVIWGSTDKRFGFYPYYGNESKVKYRSIENESLACRPCSKYGRNKCPKKHMNCLKGLKTAQIHDALEKVLRT